MPLAPLQLVTDTHYVISGNVTVHPTAAIAPGVLLHADSDSSLIIGAGVSLGMGSVLHAHGGTLELAYGVSLGAGVLMVGSGRIGENVCIGAMATILESSIEPEQVVPFGALVGDGSRQVPQLAAADPAANGKHPVSEEVVGDVPAIDEAIADSTTTTHQATTPSTKTSDKVVYGQKYVQQMISSLLPYNSYASSLPLDTPTPSHEDDG